MTLRRKDAKGAKGLGVVPTAAVGLSDAVFVDVVVRELLAWGAVKRSRRYSPAMA